jgi:hypothetical protein
MLLSETGARTAFGASCPFPWVLANVPSPNPQQPFVAGNNLLGQALSLVSSVGGSAMSRLNGLMAPALAPHDQIAASAIAPRLQHKV